MTGLALLSLAVGGLNAPVRAATGASGPGYAVKSHALEVSIDVEAGTVKGLDRLTLREPPAGALTLYIRRGSDVTGVELQGRSLEFTVHEVPETPVKEVRIPWPEGTVDLSPGSLVVRFEGSFPGSEEAQNNIRRGVAFIDDGVVSPEGVILTSGANWYPRQPDESALFSATFTLPPGYTAVAEGEWTLSKRTKSASIDRWRTHHTLDGLDLVAARFKVRRASHRGVRLYTFFLTEDIALSDLYINQTRAYLDLYSEMIAPYPFKKFAVVENFLPTGYGMPSFTLLGSTVLRLPFIPYTSLGHEIAHSWWGNSVFIDPHGGNWAEALTSYTADYLYARRAGGKKALDYRLDQLRKFKSFADASKVTLRGFSDSTATESRAVGYAKGTMVFNMLAREVGPETFTAGLKAFYRERAFKRATWKDIQRAFEEVSARDLGWFFDEWLERAGGPVLSLEDVRRTEKDGTHALELTIRQEGEPYRLTLDVEVLTTGGFVETQRVRRQVTIDKKAERVRIKLEDKPVRVEVDPEYDSFRVLSDTEVPPTFGGCFGDASGVVVLPGGLVGDQYLDTADLIRKDYGLEIRADSDADARKYLEGRTVVLLGGPGENALFELVEDQLYPELKISGGVATVDGTELSDGGFVAVALKNPYNKRKHLCLLFGTGGVSGYLGPNGDEVTLAVSKRLRYYTKMSYMLFPPEGQVTKGIFTSGNALSHRF